MIMFKSIDDVNRNKIKQQFKIIQDINKNIDECQTELNDFDTKLNYNDMVPSNIKQLYETIRTINDKIMKYKNNIDNQEALVFNIKK